MRWYVTNVTLVRKTCKNLAVVVYNRYMINVQNFIQILSVVLSDGRLIRQNIQYFILQSNTTNQCKFDISGYVPIVVQVNFLGVTGG